MKRTFILLYLALCGCGGRPQPPLVITSEALPGAIVGHEYSAKLEADNGRKPYHWALAPGSKSLPPGLELDGDTGEIHGTPLPEAGSDEVPGTRVWTFKVRVTDSK